MTDDQTRAFIGLMPRESIPMAPAVQPAITR
jgi:hypothetical protein